MKFDKSEYTWNVITLNKIECIKLIYMENQLCCDVASAVALIQYRKDKKKWKKKNWWHFLGAISNVARISTIVVWFNTARRFSAASKLTDTKFKTQFWCTDCANVAHLTKLAKMMEDSVLMRLFWSYNFNPAVNHLSFAYELSRW